MYKYQDIVYTTINSHCYLIVLSFFHTCGAQSSSASVNIDIFYKTAKQIKQGPLNTSTRHTLATL